MAENLLNEIYEEHQQLLEIIEGSETETIVPDVRRFIERIGEAGAAIPDPRQRSQLRALARFWGGFIYDRIGEFPETSLLPATIDLESPPVEEESEGVQVPETDSRFGAYRILNKIGEGGFSTVYRAFDTVAERLVALKILHGEQFERVEQFRERFIERENTIGDLDHPHIIPVYEVGEEQGIPYIAMKYVESGSLADRLSEWFWRPTICKILNIALQTVDALEYLHAQDIVHRDIKPANILLDFDDNVYLTDFGIAQVIESAFKGMIVGTPEYLAPEAILHPEKVDESADIYSLGVVLFELLEGKVPFCDGSPLEIMHQQVNRELPDLSGDLPESLRDLVVSCLAKDPGDRIEVTELREQIEHLLQSLPQEILDTQPAPFVTSPEDRRRAHPTTAMSVAREAMPVPAPPPVEGNMFCDMCGASLPPRAPEGQEKIRPMESRASEADTQILEGGPRLVVKGVLAVLIAAAGLPNNKYYVMERDRVVLGRGQYNDIVIDNPTVSLQHALLAYRKPSEKQGSFTIFDLASANGILVNGEPCIKRRLKHNDIIGLGEVRLIFKRLDR